MATKHQGQYHIDANDVIRWNSNNTVPPTEILTEFLIDGWVSQEQVVHSLSVKKAEDDAFLAQYIANRRKFGYSDEERFEMQAAFAGEEVVDIFTGEVVQY